MPDGEKIVLVIDDEEGARDMVKSFLEDREYKVVTTPSGKEGIGIIQEGNTGLVLLDMRMPEMNGLDVLTELKNKSISANVYLMTAVDEGEEFEKARTLGIKGIVKKPVDMPELCRIVKENIGR